MRTEKEIRRRMKETWNTRNEFQIKKNRIMVSLMEELYDELEWVLYEEEKVK